MMRINRQSPRYIYWKHYIVQMAVGLTVGYGSWYLTKDWAPPLIRRGVHALLGGG